MAVDKKHQRRRQPEPRRQREQRSTTDRCTQRERRAQHGHNHEFRNKMLQLDQLVAERAVVVRHTTQCRAQAATICEALRGLLLQAPHHRVGQILRHRRRHLRERLRPRGRGHARGTPPPCRRGRSVGPPRTRHPRHPPTHRATDRPALPPRASARGVAAIHHVFLSCATWSGPPIRRGSAQIAASSSIA